MRQGLILLGSAWAAPAAPSDAVVALETQAVRELSLSSMARLILDPADRRHRAFVWTAVAGGRDLSATTSLAWDWRPAEVLVRATPRWDGLRLWRCPAVALDGLAPPIVREWIEAAFLHAAFLLDGAPLDPSSTAASASAHASASASREAPTRRSGAPRSDRPGDRGGGGGRAGGKKRLGKAVRPRAALSEAGAPVRLECWIPADVQARWRARSGGCPTRLVGCVQVEVWAHEKSHFVRDVLWSMGVEIGRAVARGDVRTTDLPHPRPSSASRGSGSASPPVFDSRADDATTLSERPDPAASSPPPPRTLLDEAAAFRRVGEAGVLSGTTTDSTADRSPPLMDMRASFFTAASLSWLAAALAAALVAVLLAVAAAAAGGRNATSFLSSPSAP